MRVFDAFHAKTGWFYGRCENGGAAVPVGYCADAKPHRHQTEDNARACYKDWLLDTALRLNVAMEHQHDCAICYKPTRQVAEVDGEAIYLCRQHMNRKAVQKVFDLPGQMIEATNG